MSNEGEEMIFPMSKEQEGRLPKMFKGSIFNADVLDSKTTTLESELNETNTQLDYLDDKHKQLKKETDTRLHLLRDSVMKQQFTIDVNYSEIQVDRMKFKRTQNLMVSAIWSVVAIILYLIIFIMAKESVFFHVHELRTITLIGSLILGCILLLIYDNYRRMRKYLIDDENRYKGMGYEAKNALKSLTRHMSKEGE